MRSPVSTELLRVENPHVPREAKEHTLRRLDGLDAHDGCARTSREGKRSSHSSERRPRVDEDAQIRGRREKLMKPPSLERQHQRTDYETVGRPRRSEDTERVARKHHGTDMRRALSEPRRNVQKEVRFADGSRPRHAGSSAGSSMGSKSSSGSNTSSASSHSLSASPRETRKGGHKWFSLFDNLPKQRFQSLGIL